MPGCHAYIREFETQERVSNNNQFRLLGQTAGRVMLRHTSRRMQQKRMVQAVARHVSIDVQVAVLLIIMEECRTPLDRVCLALAHYLL